MSNLDFLFASILPRLMIAIVLKSVSRQTADLLANDNLP